MIFPGADGGFLQLVDVLIDRGQRLRVRCAVKFSIGNARYFAQTSFIEGDRRILIINITASVRDHAAGSLIHHWKWRDPVGADANRVKMNSEFLQSLCRR